jgi:hypothetical protein
MYTKQGILAFYALAGSAEVVNEDSRGLQAMYITKIAVTDARKISVVSIKPIMRLVSNFSD